MSWLTTLLRRRKIRQRDALLRKGIDPKHDLRRSLAYYVKHHGFEIGDFSYGYPKIELLGSDRKLIVGKYCSIAGGVKFILGGNHHIDHVTTFTLARATGKTPVYEGLFSRGDIVIGSDVWIGLDATILSGVTIGHGAIVGACAVVAKDVPPYTIVVGNPARPVRKRLADEHIARLLELRWWDFTDEQVAALQPLLQSNEIDMFIETACRLTGKKLTGNTATGDSALSAPAP